jgi:DNA-binding transcriptional LysR family regulator
MPDRAPQWRLLQSRRREGGIIHMRLRYIELFHAILTTGSLTGAAELLNISEPAASKALRHAEQQLGFALFSRVRGRLQPTDQALLMGPRIERIIEEVYDLQRLTANIGQPQNQPLRVTCTPTLAQTLLPEASRMLRKHFANITVELATQHSDVMCEALRLRETDIGLTLQDTNRQTLRQKSLCHGRVVVIAPPRYWLEAELGRPLPISALADQTMVGIMERDALGGMLQSHLSQLDHAPHISFWVQTYQLARALVAKGEGLALVDPFTAHGAHGEAVQIRPLEPRLDLTLFAIYRPDNALTTVQKRFLDLVAQLAQKILAGAA